MGISSNTQTLFFESTASRTTGGNHISTGQTNQLLPATGAAMGNNHMSAALVLPKLSMNATMHAHPGMNAKLKLPSVTGIAYFGNKIAFKLPSVKLTMGMTIPNILRATIVLPSVTGSATGTTGGLAEFPIVLPKVTGVAYFGNKISIVLPRVIGSAKVTVGEHMTAAILLPKVKLVAVGHRSQDTIAATIILPKLRTGQQSRFNNLVLPRLIVAASMTNNAVVTYQGWVMNLENKAVTQFSNFPFRAFVRWRDHYYGVGMSGGLYLLEGDTDAGTVIPWSWETGLDDMGSNAEKGCSGVYIEGTIEPGADVTIINDKKQRYVYPTHAVTSGSDRQRYRVVTGKGIRSSNFGFAMSSLIGGYVEINSVSPKYVVSKRNI